MLTCDFACYSRESVFREWYKDVRVTCYGYEGVHIFCGGVVNFYRYSSKIIGEKTIICFPVKNDEWIIYISITLFQLEFVNI